MDYRQALIRIDAIFNEVCDGTSSRARALVRIADVLRAAGIRHDDEQADHGRQPGGRSRQWEL